MAPETPEQALGRAIQRAGGKAALARALGFNRQNIQIWTRIPVEHVPAVSRVTGIPRYQLRPDLPEIFPPSSKRNPNG